METCLDAAAAAWIAGCTAFALATGAESLGGTAPLALWLGGSGVVALVTFRLLQKLERPPAALPQFEVPPLDAVTSVASEIAAGELLLSHDMAVGLPELLLTRPQMLHAEEGANDELLLDDVLVQPQPGSRVVQLFDPSRMPTAGELKARIDRHLGYERRDAPDLQPDASQALYDALADLRRSLG